MSKKTAYGVIWVLALANVIAISCAIRNNPKQFNLTGEGLLTEFPQFEQESTEFRIIKDQVILAKQPKPDLPEIKWAKDTLIAQAIYRKLQELDIQHPDIVLCQVILETGHFTSYAYRHRNNLLGIGGDYSNNRRFSNKDESLEYYKRWQERLYNESTKKSTQWSGYYDFLERLFQDNRNRWLRYAEDPRYVYKLKRIHRMVFGEPPTALG